jgi:hypothetical protein
MGRACSMHGVEETAYRILEKPEGKRPQGRPRRKWEDLREIGWGVWTGLIWLTTGTS